jgi:hypothetical protein
MAEGDTTNAQDRVESEDEEIVFQYRKGSTTPVHHEAGDGARNWNKPIKIDNFTGEKQSWRVWLRTFEKIARLNHWSDEMANRLFAHLRGAPLEVACSLPDHELENYNQLVNVLESQFGPARQKELHVVELRNLKLKEGQSFRELARSIRKLSELAYDANYEERERLAKVDFLSALPEGDLRKQVFLGQPSSLDEAVQLAERIAGYDKWSNEDTKPTKRTVTNVQHEGDETAPTMNMNKIEEIVTRLLQNQEDMRRQRRRRDVICYNCSQVGHYSRDWPLPPRPAHQGN